MKKTTAAVLFFSWSLLVFANVFAETYQSEHFIIHSDLDPRYVRIVQANAEAFYNNMAGKYFSSGWNGPLKIYYSKTPSETFKLLCKHGHNKRGSNIKARISCYIHKTPAIYTHQFSKEGNRIGLGTLFHEITHHFVRLNFKDPPTWLNEGLACFLGNETVIVKGQVTLGQPSPWQERRLKEQLERGIRPNIKRLLPMSQKQLYNWPIGYHFSRAVVYWLYEEGKLEKYLQNARSDGYELWVLEKTVKKPVNQINRELLAFIKKDCYAGAYLTDGWRAGGGDKEREAFLKALELKPYYARARLALARSYYRERDYKQARSYLEKILMRPQSLRFRPAADMMGDCYRREKKYARALEYYHKALDYAEYYEYKYELCYWMARCYHYLEDYQAAKKFYKMFLDNNWEPEKRTGRIKRAKDYQNRSEVRGNDTNE